MERRKQKNDRHFSNRIIGILILGAIFVAMVSFVLSFRQRQSEIEDSLGQKIELVRVICQKYDDYETGLQTEELQTLINKANILQLYIEENEGEIEQLLREYAERQYLAGIVVLDQNLRQVYNLSMAGQDNCILLNRIYGKHQVENILKYPQMVFADFAQVGEKEYGFAVVSRMDDQGIIICYQDQKKLYDDKQELSFESMLEISTENSEGILVVADGEKIVYSNSQSLSGKAVAECPLNDVVSHDMIPENKELIKLKYEDSIWYGKATAYRGYYLYIFYKAEWIYPKLIKGLCVPMGIYLIFSLFTLLYIQRQKRVELYQSEREYYMLTSIASIYDANLLLHLDDNTWEVILQTKAMEREITGISDADEMLRVFCDRLMMESAREPFLEFVELETIEKRLDEKSFLAYNFEAVDGVWYQALLIPKNRNEDNKITTVMLLLRNVTEQAKKDVAYREELRIALEKADTANAAKTDFLRRMSHDIRTPINGILGMANIGLDISQDEEMTRNCFEKICYASEYLLELVNNVLDMSKIESGKVEIEHIPFDFRKIWNETKSIVTSQAVGAGIHLLCSDLEGEHFKLIGSPLNIQRVLQNIINNAVKYNKPGGSITVSCREKQFEENVVTYEFVCKDTGIGMSEEFQKHAFELFAQEHKTARTKYPGSGLGLPIVKKTVEALGGTISLISEEGVGTTFTVTLPIQVDCEEEQSSESVNDGKYYLKGIHILLVEDNDLNGEIACYMLTEQGMEVTLAKNGREAVEFFASSEPGTYDLILMDIMMPEMNGLDATRQIRSMDREDARVIPIIAASANAFSDDVEASRASGMNEHLSKPLNFKEVFDTIGKYVRL